MTYTSHGHHIAGTTKDDEFGQIARTRCGGQLLCTVCMKDAESVLRALELGAEVEGLFDAPEVSKDDQTSSVLNKAKLFVVGARNNTVSDEKDQLTTEDLGIVNYQNDAYGWTATIMTKTFQHDGLLFMVRHIAMTDTTVVETYKLLEHDVFSQES